MDPNNPFTLILQAIIGGVVETVAGSDYSGTSPNRPQTREEP
jgi:hypothetical protein